MSKKHEPLPSHNSGAEKPLGPRRQSGSQQREAASKPNIVFLLMDNLGLSKYPPIAPGTPDPYVTPKSGL